MAERRTLFVVDEDTLSAGPYDCLYLDEYKLWLALEAPSFDFGGMPTPYVYRLGQGAFETKLEAYEYLLAIADARLEGAQFNYRHISREVAKLKELGSGADGGRA